ncbi:hypothetical protein ABB37_04262 [Leptomonas pyrrhocoris]|uniref:Conserved oligomeric Golgi complex subunit 4 n=1 Tax=Leptomonas pyrrhocoris TaxID=157538 RepID=A0A0M9G2J0_LEPPY|nr:hypothetical protein ABB37_04262 [Leptomonas pyrrhocoris]XP_015659276.1 hypothetical protein ABB37_04262 [Leptomonas pyrrhocoris]KPA80836.1 hypothetical protein ABB37_04262 [Leptomonas pyrrhocoris]KPA80837.1 hypothetical protein ABB37_04262 [Leptomonas pyrrhocoris]|eukprot:XP_015659275.1 hypothetical protein ABB37_04262 [Leptomonas pyrrhocoris]
MLLKHIDSVEERADQLLQRVQDSVRRRDAFLQQIRQSVHADGELNAALHDIDNVRYRLMPQYVHRSAALARTVAANASLAERSSKRVRRLDVLLQRVQETNRIVEAMRAMESDVAQVSTVLEAGDIEKTVELLHSYKEAQRVLMTASPSAVTGTMPSPTPTTADGDVMAEEDGLHGNSNASHINGADASRAAAASSNSALISDVMRNARETVHARLLTMIQDAVAVNDKLTIMKLTRLLAELGETSTAANLYSTWIADHTIAALAKLIDGEMKKMDDPAEVAMTHLALVSQCLDNVAAAFENDEEFTREAFGAQGPLTLLTELHSRATARCVPVLSDFIDRRKGVLAQLETHAAAAQSSRNDSSSNSKQARASSPGPAGSAAARASSPLSAAAASSSSNNQNAVVASARRADQILEEMSHVVSCGYIYLTFVQKKQTEYEARRRKEETAAAGGEGESDAVSDAAGSSSIGGNNTADSLWRTRDNALLNSMQDILAFYVPLQNTYFAIAYDQAVDLQMHAIRDAATQAAAAAARAAGSGDARTRTPAAASAVAAGAAAAGWAGGNSRSLASAALPSAAAATTFMSGLQNLYAVAASSADELIGSVGGGTAATTTMLGGASDQADLALFWYYTHKGQVTLPDDVFFVLRMAMHRAMNTKSAQICSAVIMSIMDVVQSRLLPEIEQHTLVVSGGGAAGAATTMTGVASPVGTGGARRRTTATHGGFLSPDELHWTGAAQQTATYLQRMADELQQLSSTTFASSTRDVARFRELASDMRTQGRNLQDKQIPSWLDSFADVCCDSILPPHMERFAAVSYDMKEEVYYHYEMIDVWVQACLVDLGAGLRYLHQHLAEAKLFDTLLTAMARRVAKATSGVLLRKRFSLFGALQVDKDVRALRTFFVELAQTDLSPIRGVFAPLNLMATLLLSDRPTDALEEAANTALTGEEKKKVLLTRVEFRKEAVMSLPL